MSEEEKKAIDILINEIADIVVGEYCTHCKICENEDTECYYTKAIDTVYNLINKQQKEIEYLREDNQYQWGERCRLALEVDGLYKENINKDKIREKIKEINNKALKHKCNYSEYYYKKEVLNELLEE